GFIGWIPASGPARSATDPGGSVSLNETGSNSVATGEVLDETHWPTVRLAIRNPHTFWLKWSVANKGDLVTSNPDQNDTWARFGYIPPDSEARFEVLFDPQRDSSIQFFLNAGRTKDGSLPAAVITVMQHTFDMIF